MSPSSVAQPLLASTLLSYAAVDDAGATTSIGGLTAEEVVHRGLDILGPPAEVARAIVVGLRGATAGASDS
jgi:hypothetical protein